MGNIKQIAVGMIRQSVGGLTANINATPADKLVWKPLDAGRSILDVAMECGAISFFAAKTLATRENPVMDDEKYQQLKEATDSGEKAVKLLQDGTDALIAAIEGFPDEHLQDKVTMPWGMEMTFAETMMLVYWNNVYHNGQICYIQTLYGDKQMHGF